MHKWILLLTKAENSWEAIGNVEEFLSNYWDGRVWDWYQVWGRWTSVLAPMRKKFSEWAREILDMNWWHCYSMKEVEDKNDQLQKLWEDIWWEWVHPYSDHYKLWDKWWLYDVMELEKCIDIVKEWCRDLEKEKEEARNEMIKTKKEADKKKKEWQNTWDCSPYYAWRYKDFAYWNFCFDTNVYDITEDVSEKIPTDINWYYCVVVDIHN